MSPKNLGEEMKSYLLVPMGEKKNRKDVTIKTGFDGAKKEILIILGG